MIELEPLQGYQAVLRGFDTMDERVQQGAEEGLVLAGLYLFARSQELVPVDTGALRASGTVRRRGRGLKARVWIIYSVYYALYVHEMVHIARRNGRIPKFVEVPMRSRQHVMLGIIEGRIRMRLAQS